MGWDTYARWKGMTDSEKEEQLDFYSQGGHNGYLRGGNPFSEAVDNMTTEKNGVGAAQIPAQRLRTLLAQESKECLDYPEWEAFVECCEQREQETGEPVTIFISY